MCEVEAAEQSRSPYPKLSGSLTAQACRPLHEVLLPLLTLIFPDAVFRPVLLPSSKAEGPSRAPALWWIKGAGEGLG